MVYAMRQFVHSLRNQHYANVSLVAIVICSTILLTSCAMSTMETPVMTPKGHIVFQSAAVFAGEVMDPESTVPLWISTGLRYGITDTVDTGFSIFGDAAVADLKYGFIENRENGPCVAARAGGGYGIFSRSYSVFEPIGGWNYRNIVLPYLSLRTMSYWEREVYTFAPAVGISFLPYDNLSFHMESRFYINLPGSKSFEDMSIPNEIAFGPDMELNLPDDLRVQEKHFSFHVGVSMNFDPYFFF